MYGTPSRSEYAQHGNTRRRGAENLFKEIMVKNFLNLRRDMYIQYKKFKGPQLDSTQ